MLKEIFLYCVNSSVKVFKSNTIKTLLSFCFATYLTSAFISFPLDSVIVAYFPISIFLAASLSKTVANEQSKLFITFP